MIWLNLSARPPARRLRITVSNVTATVAAFVRLGLLMEAEKDDDRALEAAIAQLCRAGVRALEADQKQATAKGLKSTLITALAGHTEHRTVRSQSQGAYGSCGECDGDVMTRREEINWQVIAAIVVAVALVLAAAPAFA